MSFNEGRAVSSAWTASDALPASKGTYILRARHSMVPQRLHATLILVVPTVAVGIAGWQVWRGTVKAWEVSLSIGLYLLTTLGITVGFHRLFAHRAFQAGSLVRATIAIMGSMAAQGPVIYWVANHRRHHRFSDSAGDPHSPLQDDTRPLKGWAGFWHAHVGWTFTHQLTNSATFCKDLLRDSRLTWVNRYYYHWVLLGIALPTLAGALIEHSWAGAANGLLWGVGVRLFITYHIAGSINSITHLFGYRSFATSESSRNNLWLGLPTLGEGWHNNHHAYPSSALFGYTWWEVDIGGAVIRLLEMFGLAWAVRRPKEDLLARIRSQGISTKGRQLLPSAENDGNGDMT